jgi:hypothetical protein
MVLVMVPAVRCHTGRRGQCIGRRWPPHGQGVFAAMYNVDELKEVWRRTITGAEARCRTIAGGEVSLG